MTHIDPKQIAKAKEWATDNLEAGSFLHGERVMAAAEVIAAMRVEESHRIINPETNGGAYQTQTMRRLVTDWTADV